MISRQQVMLYFFKRGELLNFVTLDQIIRGYSKLERTESHYAWGMFNGLDQNGRYVIETVEGRTVRFDVATDTRVGEESTHKAPDQTKTPRH